MKITNVTNDDGRACAYLIAFIKSGKWELSAEQADQLVTARRWLAGLATSMATELKGPPVPAPSADSASSGFRIKSTGPIAGSGNSRKRKK